MRTGIIKVISIPFLVAFNSHSTSAASWTKTHPSFMVYIRTYGGFCPDGPCGGETIIDKSGRIFGRRFSNHQGSVIGSLGEKSMAELTQQIENTDLEKIANSHHVGTCSSAEDGPDEEWIFNTSNGYKTIDSCRNNLHVVSTNLFQSLNDALRKATAKH